MFSPMRFEFATATRIVFGVGMLREAAPLAKDFGSRALLVTGRDPGRAGALIAALGQQEIQVTTFAVQHEPSLDLVQTGVALAKEQQCDLVISMGGGSAIDTGKAIAALLTNPGELLDYLEII